MKETCDPAATWTIVVAAAVALGTAWFLPWWTMESRAPQYGQRALVVDVSPREVTGDVFEVDTLGHYVGIRPLGAVAKTERTLAPWGLVAVLAGLFVAPWLRRRVLRLLAVLPIVLFPLAFVADVGFWMERSVRDLDPDAALEIQPIDPKLLGAYEVGQFKVEASAGGGLYLAGLAGLLGLGLAFAAPLPAPFRRRRLRAPLAAGLALALVPSGDARADLAGDVAAAEDGATVVVPAGVHRVHLKLDRPIRLVGEPGAVLDGGGEGTVLRIEAGGVEVRDLAVRGSGDVYSTEDAGVRIDRAAGVVLSGLQIEDSLFGVFVARGDRCTIERTRIVGKDVPHVRRGDGIRLWYSSGCRLAGNVVERSRDVVVWYSSDTVAEDNVVRESRYGLHYMYSDRNVFRRNRFESNQVGAAIMYSRGIVLEENAFSFSNGPSAHGLLVKDADDVFVRRNRFVSNDTALLFDGAPQSKGGAVEVEGNLVARNRVGVALQPLSRGLAFWRNSFVGNDSPLQVLGSGAVENVEWARGGRGNHWSEAVVYDRDGDGVSEIPYRVESTYESLVDRHPVLAFFQGTPGAESIDLATRLFPVVAPRPRLVDPHPLVEPELTAFLRSEGEGRGGPGLAVSGVGLLLLGALPFLARRRTLS